jgi:hypothetical protein
MRNRISSASGTEKTFTPGDAVLLLVLILGAVGAVPFIQSHSPATVVVYKDNTLYAEYPLDINNEFIIDGSVGRMKVRIGDTGVAVVSSTCSKQICLHGGVIRMPFQQLICVPNHILIEIQSKKAKEKIDAFIR